MQNKSNKTPNQISKLFGDFANVVARAAGKPAAFVIAAAIIVVWAGNRPGLSILRHVAAHHQHRNNDRHLLDGVSHSELAKPR